MRFEIPRRNQGANDSPRRRRPLNGALIDMPPPRRGVIAPGGEAELDHGHRLFLESEIRFRRVGEALRCLADEAGESLHQSVVRRHGKACWALPGEVAGNLQVARGSEPQTFTEESLNLEECESDE